jgi:hypothetical protein
MTGHAATARQFVILRHEMPPESSKPSHWDLMLEGSQLLDTWSLSEEPRVGSTQAAERLPGHRRVYLTYEGPISGNRGSVARWDRGPCHLRQASETLWIAQLDGSRLRCWLRLERTDGNDPSAHRWICRFLSGDSVDAC